MQVDCNIVQINEPKHTSKDAIGRILSRGDFEGAVQPGRSYIIVDDVVTQGGTLSELRNYIESNGGKVACASTLSFSKFSMQLGIKRDTILELERKFGRNDAEKVIRELGVGDKLECLTTGEGRYILSYANLDTFRERAAEVYRSAIEPDHPRGIEKVEKISSQDMVKSIYNWPGAKYLTPKQADSLIEIYNKAIQKHPGYKGNINDIKESYANRKVNIDLLKSSLSNASSGAQKKVLTTELNYLLSIFKLFKTANDAIQVAEAKNSQVQLRSKYKQYESNFDMEP